MRIVYKNPYTSIESVYVITEIRRRNELVYCEQNVMCWTTTVVMDTRKCFHHFFIFLHYGFYFYIWLPFWLFYDPKSRRCIQLEHAMENIGIEHGFFYLFLPRWWNTHRVKPSSTVQINEKKRKRILNKAKTYCIMINVYRIPILTRPSSRKKKNSIWKK